MTPLDPEYQERTRANFLRQRFVVELGLEISAMAPGRFEVQLMPRPEHLQQDGFLHAGVVATLADMAGGLACFTLFEPDEEIVTSEIKVNYVRPAVGERFVARGVCKRRGGRLAVGAADIFAIRGDNEFLVATSLQTTVPMRREG